MGVDFVLSKIAYFGLRYIGREGYLHPDSAGYF